MKKLIAPLFVLLAAGCGDEDTSRKVTYRIEGYGDRVTPTYKNGGGGVSQEKDVTLPWEKTFTFEKDEYVTYSVLCFTDYGQPAGCSFEASIVVDGEVWKAENTGDTALDSASLDMDGYLE